MAFKVREMQKSYNPFKMIGSWIGFILPALLSLYIFSSACVGFLCGNSQKSLQSLINNIIEHPSILFVVIILGIIGFLIGWGIHSLIKKIFDRFGIAIKPSVLLWAITSVLVLFTVYYASISFSEDSSVKPIPIKLASYAPRYDTHIISGTIFINGVQLRSGSVTFYNPLNQKEMLVDKDLSDGKYELDLSYLPSGWRVDDIEMLEIHYSGILIQKNIIVKEIQHQVEDVRVKI